MPGSSSPKRWRLGVVAALIVAMTGLLLNGAIPSVAAALDAVQYNYSVSFAQGTAAGTKTITPVTPTGKVLVIQNISIYCNPPSTSSNLQTFVGVGGGFIALPDITGSGETYPAAASNLTAYVAAETSAYVNMYRTGSSLPAMTAYITVTGYLTAN